MSYQYGHGVPDPIFPGLHSDYTAQHNEWGQPIEHDQGGGGSSFGQPFAHQFDSMSLQNDALGDFTDCSNLAGGCSGESSSGGVYGSHAVPQPYDASLNDPAYPSTYDYSLDANLASHGGHHAEKATLETSSAPQWTSTWQEINTGEQQDEDSDQAIDHIEPFTLPITELGFEFETGEELCWKSLCQRHMNILIHLVNEETDYKKSGIREKLRTTMTPVIALALLSGDQDLFRHAIAACYPSYYTKERHVWKHGLSNDEVSSLIKRLCRASGHDGEVIRHYLSHRMVNPLDAYQLAHGDDALLSLYVTTHKLIKPALPIPRRYKYTQAMSTAKGDRYSPWMCDTNSYQRRTIVEIVKKLYGHLDPKNHSGAYKILRKSTITDDDRFGLNILEIYEKQGAEEALKYIQFMTDVSPKVRRKVT
ncbi:hypothetical protein CBS101457_000262 [Exobasidium rhododendri]|nr:hypothetical protein CBS101457_000262 [Exobasidium rhododendri]